MGEIFTVTDRDGDHFSVETLTDESPYVIDVAVNGTSAWLTAAEVGGLVAAITPHIAKAKTAIVTGREYRLLPGATTALGGDVYFDEDVTKVRVEHGPVAGDYYVRALNGAKDQTCTQYVGPAFLASLDAPAEDGDDADGSLFLDSARVEAVEYVADNFTEFTAAELLDVARFLLLED